MKVKRKERKKRSLLTRFEIYEFLDFLQNKTQESLNFHLSSILILSFSFPHSFSDNSVSLFIYIRGFAPLHWLKGLIWPILWVAHVPPTIDKFFFLVLHFQSHILNSNNFFNFLIVIILKLINQLSFGSYPIFLFYDIKFSWFSLTTNNLKIGSISFEILNNF